MAELLQTHRLGVALPTFGTSTRPSAYKNVPKTPNHRPVFLKVPTIIDMEHQLIERILDRVHSLDDLSVDDLIELRRISEQSIIIDKFKVSPAQYYDWLDKVDDIRGVEYDGQNSCVILKGGPGWMHEVATGVVNVFLDRIRDRMSAATGSPYFLTGSKILDCVLAGKFSRSSKQADASLMNSKAKWPVVVLEVGISETTKRLHDDAERWLEGSNGQTKLVILVDVQETPKWKTENHKWELSKIDFQETSHDRLSDNILQWYRSQDIRLVGSFKLSVHLWYSDGVKQCILDEAPFSPGNLIDLTTIVDFPLRLEYLMPGGSDSDISQPLLFPLRHLVNTLQNGFEIIESDRADLMAEKEQKK